MLQDIAVLHSFLRQNHTTVFQLMGIGVLTFGDVNNTTLEYA